MRQLKCGWRIGFSLVVVMLIGAFAQAEPHVYRENVAPHWFAGNTRFWYRNDLAEGRRQFVLVDAEKGTRGPAFDHARLAMALGKTIDGSFAADHLPLEDVIYAEDGESFQATVGGKIWRVDLKSYAVEKVGRK